MLLEDFNAAGRAEAAAVLRPAWTLSGGLTKLLTPGPVGSPRKPPGSRPSGRRIPSPATEVEAALAHHPRIGERAAGNSTEARLSPVGAGNSRRSGHCRRGSHRRGKPRLRGEVRPGVPDPRVRPQPEEDPGRPSTPGSPTPPRGTGNHRPAAARNRGTPTPRTDRAHEHFPRHHPRPGHRLRQARRRASPSPWTCARRRRTTGPGSRPAPRTTDGRIKSLGPTGWPPGRYRLGFDTGAYHAATRNRDLLSPKSSLTFAVEGSQAPLPRAAPAKPVRVFHLPRQLDRAPQHFARLGPLEVPAAARRRSKLQLTAVFRRETAVNCSFGA